MNEESLMRSRIRKILMICSNYDAFALEEDGRIENQVKNEYRELNLSNPPKFIWANSSAQARDIIGSEEDIDMIICMYNEAFSVTRSTLTYFVVPYFVGLVYYLLKMLRRVRSVQKRRHL